MIYSVRGMPLEAVISALSAIPMAGGVKGIAATASAARQAALGVGKKAATAGKTAELLEGAADAAKVAAVQGALEERVAAALFNKEVTKEAVLADLQKRMSPAAAEAELAKLEKMGAQAAKEEAAALKAAGKGTEANGLLPGGSAIRPDTFPPVPPAAQRQLINAMNRIDPDILRVLNANDTMLRMPVALKDSELLALSRYFGAEVVQYELKGGGVIVARGTATTFPVPKGYTVQDFVRITHTHPGEASLAISDADIRTVMDTLGMRTNAGASVDFRILSLRTVVDGQGAPHFRMVGIDCAPGQVQWLDGLSVGRGPGMRYTEIDSLVDRELQRDAINMQRWGWRPEQP